MYHTPVFIINVILIIHTEKTATYLLYSHYTTLYRYNVFNKRMIKSDLFEIILRKKLALSFSLCYYLIKSKEQTNQLNKRCKNE